MASSALVQDYIGHVMDEVLEMGLRPEIEHNFDLFASIRGGVADKWIYPCYDPRLSDTDEDGLWVRAVDRNGQTVATSRRASSRPGILYDLMRSERLWFRAPNPGAPRAARSTARSPPSAASSPCRPAPGSIPTGARAGLLTDAEIRPRADAAQSRHRP